METGMTDKRQGRHTEHLRTKIAAGYILIFLLVGGIVHLWVDEWRKLETFETENHRINALRMEVHDVYVRVVELSLLGETVLEWEVADVEEYRDKRQAVDSLLCRFKNIYPAERIDSVRRLLEDKEKQLCGIMRVLDEQEDINERIAERVPVIAWKSTQEEPKKTKRKGLFTQNNSIVCRCQYITISCSTHIVPSIILISERYYGNEFQTWQFCLQR